MPGWISPNSEPIKDEWNIGFDHGSLEDWRSIAKNGHDIGSHTFTHPDTKYKGISREHLEQECSESLKFIKQIDQSHYSLAFPYNRGTLTSSIKKNYDSVRAGWGEPLHNSIEDTNLYHIKSWSPEDMNENGSKKIKKTIGNLPDNSWLVFNLHGLDGEGWQPWSAESLKGLIGFIKDQSISIGSISEMADVITNKNK